MLLPLALFFTAPALYAQNDSGTPVNISSAESGSIYQSLNLTGTVTSRHVSRLSTSTSGLVKTLNVDAGSHITQGDILLTLDDELVSHQLAANLARVEQAEASLEDARRRRQEAEPLIASNSIAASSVRDIDTEVATAEALLAERRAAAAYQQSLLDRHRLKAPFSGVISAKSTELGEWVNSGTGVLELVATDSLRLDFSVPENYLGSISPGADVSFRSPAFPGTEFKGHIATLVPITETGARTFLLRVEIDTPDKLIPGLSVQANLRLPTGRQGLLVHRDALLTYPDGRTVVWTAEEDDRGGYVAKENLVTTGLSFAERVEVIDGLASDAKVIVRGNEALQSQQRLHILNSP